MSVNFGLWALFTTGLRPGLVVGFTFLEFAPSIRILPSSPLPLQPNFKTVICPPVLVDQANHRAVIDVQLKVNS